MRNKNNEFNTDLVNGPNSSPNLKSVLFITRFDVLVSRVLGLV